MRKAFFLLLSVSLYLKTIAQQSLNLNFWSSPNAADNKLSEIKDAGDKDEKTKAIEAFTKALPTFGLYGIGNVNTETFTQLNSSGKLSGYIRPYKVRKFVTINFSFNVNASNTDELLPSTFLFPDVGSHSFYSTVDYSIPFFENDKLYLISPMIEFATKSIKATKNEEERFFNTLMYTVGTRFQFLHIDEEDQVSFSLTPFWAKVNVPDEDNNDYRFLFTGDENSKLKSTISSLGVKIAFQYNNFQIFADLRHISGKEDKIPIRELRGHNSNIGVVFNAEIFEK